MIWCLSDGVISGRSVFYHEITQSVLNHSVIQSPNRMSWKKIYETASPIKAQLAKAFLFDEHQIEAVIMNKQDSSYLFGLCEVHVPMQDAVLAKFLLENEGGLD